MTPLAPPPSIWNMPAGARLAAGLSHATIMPDFDFETYSEAGFVWVPETNKWAGPPNAAQGKKGLPIVGAQVYAEHPTTEVISLYYDLKDGRGRQRWLPGMPSPSALLAHVAAGGLLAAWNSGFEYRIWKYVCTRRYGWPPLPLRQLRCDAAKARAFALPGALGNAGAVLALRYQKDPAGDKLIKKFSMPQNPTKAKPLRRITVLDEPEEAERFYQYNERDIVTEAEASSRTPDLSETELEYWLMDQEINMRGVQMDHVSIDHCLALVAAAHAQYNAELFTLTGGTVGKASELKELKGWLGAHGVLLPDMKKVTIAAALADDQATTELERKYWCAVRDARAADDSIEEDDFLFDPLGPRIAPMSPVARRALEIRALVGSAAVKKLFAMSNMLGESGRLYDLYLFNGARTGRGTGAGPQPTNLPKSGPDVYLCVYMTATGGAIGYERMRAAGWTDALLVQHGYAVGCGRYFGAHRETCPWCGGTKPAAVTAREWSWRAAEDALLVIATRDLYAVEHYFGDAMATVSGCLRGLFVAAPGHDLICSDYSAIEAVVLAMLAGVAWRIEVFRTHGKIYEASAAMMSKLPMQEVIDYKKQHGVHHPLRDKGKRAELACGYGGWVGAWIAFGADKYMTEEEMKDATLAWRAASPEIPEFWGGQWRRVGRGWRRDLYGLEGAFVSAVLSPGVQFECRGFKFLVRDDVLYLTLLSGRHMAYHRPRLSPEDKYGRESLAISYEGWNTNPKRGAPGWIRINTYGAQICENIVQATARDIQWHGMLNLQRAGYPIALHVYDEDIAEVPEGFGSIEEFERIMAIMPAWAADWPIRAAGGWRGKRYRKD
jgi:hypothetical protein